MAPRSAEIVRRRFLAVGGVVYPVLDHCQANRPAGFAGFRPVSPAVRAPARREDVAPPAFYDGRYDTTPAAAGSGRRGTGAPISRTATSVRSSPSSRPARNVLTFWTTASTNPSGPNPAAAGRRGGSGSC